MKRKSTLLLLLVSICVFVAYRDVTGFSFGAPNGNTGSPSDGQTCNVCHGGAPVVVLPNLISSNIPSSGYRPDSIYTFTAKIVWPGHSTFGFQVSPQSPTGLFLGELIQTDPSTEVTGFGRYVTHVSGGISGNDSLSWTFDWQAPPAGSGSVTFYGAFNVANGDGFNSFDTIVNSSLVVPEDITVNTGTINPVKNFSVYPNPAVEQCNIYVSKPNENYQISVYRVNGQLVSTETLQSDADSRIILKLNFLKEAGLYQVGVQKGETSSFHRIVFNPSLR